MKTTALTLTASVALILLTGCSSTTTTEGQASTPQPSVTYAGAVSLAETYDSLDAVEAASALSVKGIATTAHIERIDTLDFTVTDVNVLESSDPSLVGTTVKVRQTGSTDFRLEGVTDLLEQGSTYLLFLSPFVLGDGVDTGQYTITGEQGAWKQDGKTFEPTFDGPSFASDLSPASAATLLATDQ